MRPTALLAYCTSRQHLVGCALAILGASLAVLDPVGPPGLLLVVGFYALGVAAGRPTGPIGAASFDPVHAAAALQEDVAHVCDRLPPDIRGQMLRIKDIIRFQVMPGFDVLPVGSIDRYLAERTAVDYLPAALEQYLQAATDRSQGPAPGDETSAMRVLSDELCLIESDMRRIAGVIQQTNLDRMLAHRRFLGERFGRLDPSG